MPDLEGRNEGREDVRFGEQDEDANWNYDNWHYPGRQSWWRRGWGWQDGGGWKSATDAKGYLPKVPGYDGDRQKEPNGFQVYKRKVEGFVQIAKAVIPEDQIGARLYYEVTGKAFEYLQGTNARQFSGNDGWRVLLKVLEHFDEKPIVKVGTALDGFFTCESLKEN